MITIVDYGLGNIAAFVNVYRRAGIAVAVASCADELKTAEKIILPGVGAFDWAMSRLAESGMRESLDELVLERGRPVLGVCVGMQMMARGSDEGNSPGLGWVPGRVRIFSEERLGGVGRLPHMGWNDVIPASCCPLFKGLIDDSRFYFLHSYYFEPENAADGVATANYWGDFCCAVGKGDIYGVQFHPEKSHSWGARLLTNFAEL